LANPRKTKAELLEELEALRARVEELEAACARLKETVEASAPAAERAARCGPVFEMEQRVAERTAELREAQEWIVLAKEAANLGAFDFDARSGRRQWDRRVRELWGVGPDEPVTFDVFMSGLHPDDRERTQAALNRALDPAGDGKYCTEYRVISRRDGVTRWVAATGQTFFKDGRAVRLVGTVEDITERKISEEALAQQRELLQHIFDNVPVLLVTWDSRLQRLMLNHHAESVLGWTTREANDAVDFMSEVYPDPEYQAEVSAYMLSFAPGWREWTVTTKSGERVPIDWATVHLTDDTMVGIGVDLRDRKRAEAALRESEMRFRNLFENLEETVRQKTDELVQAEHLADIGRMVATVAHEVRNPIQVIRAGVDTLHITHNDKNAQQEILEEVEYGAKMLEGTLSDLLEYARPLTLEFSFVPVKDVVEGALKLVADKFKRLSVHIELEREDAEIHVDFVKLKQVLTNVLSNAADAMPGGGSVTILSKTVELGGETFLQISISDTGRGISPDHLDDIFKPFFTTKARGTGLGLSICRRIMEEHCGDISVKSKVGEGTTAYLMIPLF
jgi:PAS domain S-box-containing protein